MVNDIQSWLEGIGLGKYVEVFAENEIDRDAAQYLTEEDLKELGIPLGPRKKVLAAIQHFEKTAAVPKGADGAKPHVAERRQLSVLFSDLVGSTALSVRLDPEDMREVLHRYQDAVAGVISRHDGYVANYLGDGVLAYFGWPRAHEDQAAQAVRAGLAAVRAVAAIVPPDGEALTARAGIATGQVVVGDLEGEISRQAAAISGETPNLAARLQALAEPGQVVIGSQTRILLGRQFDLADLGPQELKGIEGAVPAWRVRGEVKIHSRFEARASDLIDFIGREHELGLLIDRWRLAGKGEGQVVLLSGEAGIGKSRLIEELRQRTAREDAFCLTYQCAPQHVDSAFWPVIRHLQHAAGIQPEDPTSTQLDKLEALVKGDREAAQLLAVLLSLSGEDRYGALEMSPQAHKQKTIEALVGQLLALGERKPVLFLFEDAHWIDPSSTELLSETVARIVDARVLMMVTTRPEWQAPLGDQPHSTTLSLSRLGRSQAAEIVTAIAGPHIDANAVERVVSRTDGIPLFVEELTNALVERGLDAPDADIPATLQALLAARLDRLPPEAREIAQIGAVIGRQFPLNLLAAVLSQEVASLATRIDALLESGLMYRQGVGDEAVLTFKHALVQDTAYESLLIRRRRELHAVVAAMLCDQNAGGITVPPELIAHHLTEAGETRDAIIYWQHGAEAALKRSAYSEANSQLRRGLDLLAMLPETPDRQALELALQITLGPVLMVTKGQTAAEVTHTYARARAICVELGEERHLGPILIGLWRCQQGRGDAREALATAEEALRIARRTRDRMLTVDGLMAVGTAHYFLGEMIAARIELENGLSAYRTLDHVPEPGLYVRDPGVICLAYLANVLWELGYPDQARSRAEEGTDLAREIDHPLSLAHAHWQASLVYASCGDWQVSADRAETVLHLTRKHNLGPWHIANGILSRSRALAHKGRPDDALAQLAEALEIYRRIGPLTRLNRMLAAEIHLFSGDATQGLTMIDGQPKVDWLRGQLLLHHVEPEAGAAEQAFRSALDEARTRFNRSLELRAALSLARLWREQGRHCQSRDLLTPIVGWFTEGFETQDLVDAEALLRELA